MPDEIETAVGRASDAAVKVIVLRGRGRASCAGYDFAGGFAAWGRPDRQRRSLGPGQRTWRCAPTSSSRRTTRRSARLCSRIWGA
jgi:enoyl-CoA hydratase/carnithine racemase